MLLRIHEGQAEFREGAYEDHQAWVDLDLGAEEGSDSEGEAERRGGARRAEGRSQEPMCQRNRCTALEIGIRGEPRGRETKLPKPAH